MTEQSSETQAAANTDRELWRERDGDFYADSLFVTEGGRIGMNVGGSVIVKTIRDWFALAAVPRPEPPEPKVMTINAADTKELAEQAAGIIAELRREQQQMQALIWHLVHAAGGKVAIDATKLACGLPAARRNGEVAKRGRYDHRIRSEEPMSRRGRDQQERHHP